MPYIGKIEEIAMSRFKKEPLPQNEETLSPRPTESFWSRNVRLMTFLITIGAFLLICGPIFVLEARDHYISEEDTRPEMTLEDLIYLSENDYITEKALTKFACVESEDDYVRIIRITFGGGRYSVIATVDRATGAVVQCLARDLDSDADKSIDVLTEDVRAAFGK